MYLRINIKGENAQELSKTSFKKMPGKLKASNERLTDPTEDLSKYKNRKGIKFYKADDGILKKELESIELDGIYTKYEENEIEYTILGFSDNESFMEHFDSYINRNEYLVSECFMTKVKNMLRGLTTNVTDGIYSVEVEAAPINPGCGRRMLEDIFTYYGYTVEVENAPDSGYNFSINRKLRDTNTYGLTLRKDGEVSLIFKQLYVLLSALDSYSINKKSRDDYDKLIRFGEGWLENSKYLDFISSALLGKYTEFSETFKQEMRTQEVSDADSYKRTNASGFGDEEGHSLHDVLMKKVIEQLPNIPDLHLVDYGCSTGKFISALYNAYANNESTKLHVVGVDSSLNAIERANRAFNKLEMGVQTERPKVEHSSLYLTDSRLYKADVAVVMEVIEHNSKVDLEVLLDNIFMQDPHITFITSPNREYNQYMFTTKDYPYNKNGLRHIDHRFEFTSDEFKQFFNEYVDHEQYDIEYISVGKCIEGKYPTEVVKVTKKNWEAPTGYNSYPNAINDYNAKLAKYNERKAEYDAYQANPQEYMDNLRAKAEAQYQHDVENVKSYYAYKQGVIAKRASQESSADRYLIGSSLEEIKLSDIAQVEPPRPLTLEEQIAKVKLREVFEPGKPIPPSEENIVTGQRGSLFKPKEKLSKEEEFIKRKCRTEEEVQMYKKFLEESNKDYYYASSAFYKWVKTRYVSNYSDYLARYKKTEEADKDVQ